MDPKRSVLEGIRGFARQRSAGGLKNKYAKKEPVPGAAPEDEALAADQQITPEWGVDLTPPTQGTELTSDWGVDLTNPMQSDKLSPGKWGVDLNPAVGLTMGDPHVDSRLNAAGTHLQVNPQNEATDPEALAAVEAMPMAEDDANVTGSVGPVSVTARTPGGEDLASMSNEELLQILQGLQGQQ